MPFPLSGFCVVALREGFGAYRVKETMSGHSVLRVEQASCVIGYGGCAFSFPRSSWLLEEHL